MAFQRDAFQNDAFDGGSVTGSFAVDAVITKSLSGSFTAAAVIQTTVAVVGATADAQIANPRTGLATADAVLHHTQTGSVSADAQIGVRTLTADAIIQRSATSALTADAHLVRRTTASATIDAYFRKVTTGQLTANAEIVGRVYRSFTASAVMLKPGEPQILISDTFTRTWADSWWRAEYVWSEADNAQPVLEWDNAYSTPNTAWSVDGSTGVLDMTASGSVSAWTRLPTNYAPTGRREFLFRLRPEDIDIYNFHGAFVVLRRNPSTNESDPTEYRIEFRFGKSGAYNYFIGRLAVGQGYGGDWSDTYTTTDLGSTTDWVWCKTQIWGHDPTHFAAKMWVDGDPEPGWQRVYEDNLSGYGSDDLQFDVGSERPWEVKLLVTASSSLHIDDVRLRRVPHIFMAYAEISPEPVTGSFTAQAFILPHFFVDAVLFKSSAAAFSAEALISYPYFYADATIFGTISRTFTASAVISVRSTRTFTANAETCPPYASSDLGISWTIAASVTLGPSWTIGGGLSADLGLAWDVGMPVGDLPVAWNTTAPASSDLGASWTVDTPVAPDPNVLTTTILVEGVNITEDVDITKSYWQMAAGANPGTAKVYVLDRGHTASFAAGDELTLDIDELRVWGGYVVGVRRGYAFPVDDTTDAGLVPRYWILECSDYNVLFQKRFVVNKASPTDGIPDYDAGTHDDVIIRDLVDDYLYLGGDGISTRRVHHVGTPMEDSKGAPLVPAISWGDAMRKIAVLPGAIFYIDADRVLNYADVDVIDAPFRLSDQPNNTTSFGYRDLELTEDGTNLGNDAFVWGAALGVSTMTFKRYQDEASIAEHGRWQWADYRRDLYKPESVLKRATTYVDGSTQNNRGHKDDAISIRCTIRQPGLRAGMKVRFISNMFGYNDVIPIRSMRIRFANRNEALYELELAHFLDEAWNTAEFRNQEPEEERIDPCNPVEICEEVPVTEGGSAFTSGTYQAGSVTAFTTTGAELTVTEVDASTGEISLSSTEPYVLDAFDRTVSSGWGTSTDGHVWYEHFDQSLVSVDGTTGVMHWPVGNAYGEVGLWTGNYVAGPWNTLPSWEMVVKFKFTHAARAWGDPEAYLSFNTIAGTSGPANIRVYISFTNDGTYSYRLYIDDVFGGNSDFYDSIPIVPNTYCFLKWVWDSSGVHKAKVWTIGSTEPDWMVSAAGPTSLPNRPLVVSAQYKDTNQYGVADTDRYIYIDYINIGTPGVVVGDTALVCYDVCDGACVETVVPAGITDSFTRTVAEVNADGHGWGTSDAGFEWVTDGTTVYVPDHPGGYASVNGSMGILRMDGTSPSTFGAFVQSLMTWNQTSTTIDILMKCEMTGSYSGNAIPYIMVDIGPSAGSTFTLSITGLLKLWTYKPSYSQVTTNVSIGSGVPFWVRWHHEAGVVQTLTLWSVSDTEPGTPTLTQSLTGQVVANWTGVLWFILYANNPVGANPIAPFYWYFDSIDIAGLNNGGGGTTIDCTTYGYNPGTGEVYRPAHLRQLGWGTEFDGLNCTMASAAIALDRHTVGAKTATPPEMRAAQLDQSGGTDLGDAAYAWSHGWNETLSVRYGLSWSSFVAKINEGRGAIVQGMYSEVPAPYTSQPSFDGSHAVYVNEFNADGYALVYDPLATGPKWWPSAVLSDYALTFTGGTVSAGFTQITS